MREWDTYVSGHVSVVTTAQRYRRLVMLMDCKVDEFGWGYPKLATFQSSDEVFSVYRRFGYLQSRLLLEKQDALRVLENRLNDFDRKDRAKSNTRESDVHPNPRGQLLEEIERAFNSYGRRAFFF